MNDCDVLKGHNFCWVAAIVITRPKHQKFSYSTAGQNTNGAIPLYVNNWLVHLRARIAQSIQ